jgi:hypothetical protein
MHVSKLWSLVTAGALDLLALVGCSEGVRITFHPTDTSFSPRPRASQPKVYLDRDQVPRVALRSVGIIEVSGRDAAAKAARKGQALGCWALVEHSVLDSIERRPQAKVPSSGLSETNALVAHGGVHPVTSVRPSVVRQFDCVMAETNQQPDRPIIM